MSRTLAERPERTVVGEAAELAVQQLIKTGRGAAFATLEGDDHQAAGIVLVCLEPKLIDRVIEFVVSLGNFTTHVVPKGKSKCPD